jgi:DNA-binding Lrp family transcriptional regulator
MQGNHIIPVSNGLFDHRERIGSAIWEFLWCIDAITSEEVDEAGIRWGLIHNGVPVKHERIAEETGTSERTVQRNMAILKKEGYIQTVRVARGEIIKVPKNKKDVIKKRYATIVISNESDTPDLVYHLDNDTPIMEHHEERHANNGISVESDIPNVALLKDLKDLDLKIFSSTSSSDINIDFEIKVKEVETYFIYKRNQGTEINNEDYKSIRQALADGLPVEIIKSALDKAFLKHKPKHRLDKIRTFTYCAPICYDAWTKIQAITEPLEPVAVGGSTTETVSPESVALGSKSIYRTKAQKEMDELDQIIAEGKRNGPS